jgi:hypothetical protein
MKEQTRVLLSGDTLVLAGVRASLEASRAFEVIALNASHADEQEINHLCPDVIIFDMGSVQPQFPYNLIQQRSTLLLIGIDPDRSEVLLWSRRQLRELSARGLVEVICKEGHAEEEIGKKDEAETQGSGVTEIGSPNGKRT